MVKQQENDLDSIDLNIWEVLPAEGEKEVQLNNVEPRGFKRTEDGWIRVKDKARIRME